MTRKKRRSKANNNNKVAVNNINDPSQTSNSQDNSSSTQASLSQRETMQALEDQGGIPNLSDFPPLPGGIRDSSRRGGVSNLPAWMKQTRTPSEAATRDTTAAADSATSVQIPRGVRNDAEPTNNLTNKNETAEIDVTDNNDKLLLSRAVLEEDVRWQEDRLRALEERQQVLVETIRQARTDQQEHQARLAATLQRKAQLEHSQTQQVQLQKELLQTYKKSQERMAAVLAVGSSQTTAPTTLLNDGTAPTKDIDDNNTMEPVSQAQPTSQDDHVETRQDAASVDSPPTVQTVETDQHTKKPLSVALGDYPTLFDNHIYVSFFLPPLDARLVQQVMDVTVQETLALDSCKPVDSTHRRQALLHTCLDVCSDTHFSKTTTPPSISQEDSGASSPAVVHPSAAAIDPTIPLCPYELSGVCADGSCVYQHLQPREGLPSFLLRERLPLPALVLPPALQPPPQGPSSQPPQRRSLDRRTKASGKAAAVDDDRNGDGKEDAAAEVETNATPDSSTSRQPRRRDVSAAVAVVLEQHPASPQPSEAPVPMEWNDDFLSLPAAPDSNDSSSEIQDSASHTAESPEHTPDDILEEDQGDDDAPRPFWWMTEEDMMRVKSSTESGTISSVTGWLSAYAGIHLEQPTTEGGRALVVFNPQSQVAFQIVGRLVDCTRFTLRAGRFDIAFALCNLMKEVVEITQMLSQKITEFVLGLVKHIRALVDAAFSHRQTQEVVTGITFLQSAFDTELSLASISSLLLRISICSLSATAKQLSKLCSTCKTNLKSLLLELAPPLGLGSKKRKTPTRRKHELEYKDEMVVPPELDANAASLWDAFVSMEECVALTKRRNRKSVLTAEKILNGYFRPTLDRVQKVLDASETDSGKIAKIVIWAGYELLVNTQSVFKSILLNGDIDTSVAGELQDLDKVVHQTVSALDRLTSQMPSFQWMLSPLHGLCVAIACTLRRYGKAQHLLQTALKYPCHLFSELLWSQVVQLRSGLPSLPTEDANETPNRDDMVSENRTIALCVKTLGLHLNHVSLCGEFALTNQISPLPTMKKKTRRNIKWARSLFFLPNQSPSPSSDELNKVSAVLSFRQCLDRSARESARIPSPCPSLFFPRSILLCGPGLTSLDLSDCSLFELPQTFGLHFPNLKTLRLHENKLTELPSSIGSMRSLCQLFASNNRLVSLPATLVELQKLELLHLSHNQLTDPHNYLLLRLPRLYNLSLDGNPLHA